MRNKRFGHSDSRIPDLKPEAGILPVIAGMLHNKVNPSVRHRVFYGILQNIGKRPLQLLRVKAIGSIKASASVHRKVNATLRRLPHRLFHRLLQKGI